MPQRQRQIHAFGVGDDAEDEVSGLRSMMGFWRRWFGERPVERAQPRSSRDDELITARRIYLTEEITDESGEHVIAKMLFLEDRDPNRPVCLILESPGGSGTTALAVADTMAGLKCPVVTWCPTLCGGFATLLLAAGRPGMRFAAPDARLVLIDATLVETDSGGARPETQIRLLQTLDAYFEVHTGRAMSELRPYLKQGIRLNARDAVQLGFVDHLVTKPPQ